MQSKFLLPILVVLLVVITCSWVLLYRLQPGPAEHLGISFLLGSLYGHSALASAWIGLGPFNWRRVPLAVVWLFAIPCAFVANTILYFGSPPAWLIWSSAGAVVLLVQFMFLPLRFWWGLRIDRLSPVQAEDEGLLASRQFGIKELMIVTTIVAVIIGLGRVLLPYLSDLLTTLDLVIMAFLVVVAVVICIPLMLSLLAMRKPLLPSLVLLALAAVATFTELPLLASFGMPGGGPDWLHIILINTFTLLPVILVCVALRSGGYKLSASN